MYISLPWPEQQQPYLGNNINNNNNSIGKYLSLILNKHRYVSEIYFKKTLSDRSYVITKVSFTGQFSLLGALLFLYGTTGKLHNFIILYIVFQSKHANP